MGIYSACSSPAAALQQGAPEAGLVLRMAKLCPQDAYARIFWMGINKGFAVTHFVWDALLEDLLPPTHPQCFIKPFLIAEGGTQPHPAPDQSHLGL